MKAGNLRQTSGLVLEFLERVFRQEIHYCVVSGASRDNQKFLEAGGTDMLDGDGKLNYGWEKVSGSVLRFSNLENRSRHAGLPVRY